MLKLITNLQSRWMTRENDTEEGAALVEYGLLVTLVALAAIVAITGLGTKISTVFTNIAGKL